MQQEVIARSDQIKASFTSVHHIRQGPCLRCSFLVEGMLVILCLCAFRRYTEASSSIRMVETRSPIIKLSNLDQSFNCYLNFTPRLQLLGTTTLLK